MMNDPTIRGTLRSNDHTICVAHRIRTPWLQFLYLVCRLYKLVKTFKLERRA